MRYPALVTRFFTSLWALRPEDHHFISELILRRSAGETVTPEQVRAAIEGKAYGSPFTSPKAGDVAVISLHGTIMNRAGLLTVSGFTSPQDFAAAVRAAAADPNVSEIVLSIDSPGGTVDGTNTAAEAVRDAAKLKPVTAVADGMMASGAYWIASQATRVVVDPTALVGSIGVIATHVDRTREADEAGIKVSYFRSVEHKALGQPYEALTDEAASDLRDVVAAAHAQFVTAVETKRGPLSSAAATGRVFTGIEAVTAGLADQVGTLHSVLDEIVRGRQGGGRGTRAASAAGRTNVDFDAIRTALGLEPDATTEDALAAIQAMAAARDEAQAEHAKAREEALQNRAELRDANVLAVIRAARLPSVNAESDQRFIDACLAEARATDDTAAASAAIEALIADRRELLANQGTTRKASPPAGDTSAPERTIESSEIKRARAGLGLN